MTTKTKATKTNTTKTKPAKAGKPEATPQPNAETAPEQAPKKNTPKKNTAPQKASSDGKPGVIASIVEFLQSATAEAPLSKNELVAKLKQRFADREETAMQRTVHCQVPKRLREEKKLNVEKNEQGGFWIA